MSAAGIIHPVGMGKGYVLKAAPASGWSTGWQPPLTCLDPIRVGKSSTAEDASNGCPRRDLSPCGRGQAPLKGTKISSGLLVCSVQSSEILTSFQSRWNAGMSRGAGLVHHADAIGERLAEEGTATKAPAADLVGVPVQVEPLAAYQGAFRPLNMVDEVFLQSRLPRLIPGCNAG